MQWSVKNEVAPVASVIAALLVGITACQTEIVAVGGGGSGGAGGSAEAIASATIVTGVTTVAASIGVGVGSGGLDGCPVAGVPMHSLTTVGSTGTGMGCSFDSTDDMGTTWHAACTDAGCDCYAGADLICSCSLLPPGDCTFGCCPAPWDGAPTFP